MIGQSPFVTYKCAEDPACPGHRARFVYEQKRVILEVDPGTDLAAMVPIDNNLFSALLDLAEQERDRFA
jgi:hypothetical protein